MRTANAMAFDLFLALVPMLGLGGWAAALFVGNGEATSLPIKEFTPLELQEFVGHHFQALSAAHLAPLAALAGLWLSSSAFYTMLGVFEESFECWPRVWYQRRLISLGFALLGMLLLGIAGGLGVLFATLNPGEGSWFDAFKSSGGLKALVFALGYGSAGSFIALLYRYSLRRPGRKRHVWLGAVVATTLGTAASVGLAYYAANIARYALFYGGLAAIVVVLLWLLLWSSAILIGAELNIAVEDVVVARTSMNPGAIS